MTAEIKLPGPATCPRHADDPMAMLISRCNGPHQLRGSLYVIYCKWCGESAPFVTYARDAAELNFDASAAWNTRAAEANRAVVDEAMVERSARVVAEIAGEDFDKIGEFAQGVLRDTQRAALTAALAKE